MRRKRVSQATSRASSAKCSSASGSRSMQIERPRRADPVGDQARVAARAEGAVDHGLARRGRRELDQLAGQDGYVRARHVKKDCQAAPSPPRSPSRGRPAARCQRSLAQTSRWSPTPTTTTSFSMPAWSSSGGGSDDPPARVELDVEGVALEVARELAVVLPHRVQRAERALDDGLVRVRGPDGDAGFEVLGENGSEENAARNRAGMLSRFFASSECSKWPRNANAHVPGKRVQTGVAEWEEPRHSGRLGVATVPHLPPLCNTIPHFSVRRIGRCRRDCRFLALQSGKLR